MTRQQQSREFDVSDVSSIPKEKNLTRFQVPREGLFDMVALEPFTFGRSPVIHNSKHILRLYPVMQIHDGVMTSSMAR